MSDNYRGSLNEALKRREAALREAEHIELDENGNRVLALDDTQRVKVLSPSRLVAKRFFRNKLAMVGLAILIAMFVFTFLCPLIYKYSQTEIFYKYDYLNIDYASAKERTEYVNYPLAGGPEIHYSVSNRMNSYIDEMEAAGETERSIEGSDGGEYHITKLGEGVYTLDTNELIEVARYSVDRTLGQYDKLRDEFTGLDGSEYDALRTAVREGVAAERLSFRLGGVSYSAVSRIKNQYDIVQTTPSYEYFGTSPDEGLRNIVAADPTQQTFMLGEAEYRVLDQGAGSYSILELGERKEALLSSRYVLNTVDAGAAFSDGFMSSALLAVYRDGRFRDGGKAYTVTGDETGFSISDSSGAEVASLGTFVVRRYSGQDTLSLDFKEKTQAVIEEMEEGGLQASTFTWSLPEMDHTGSYIYGEDGQLSYVDTEITVNRKTLEYVLNCEQITYLIDIYGAPSREHMIGTDGDGMDILSRMMYGGRISLMVGFVVVLLEVFLGVIMGGIAGFFGGWVDSLIMRLVDVFYCIPSYPILIIMGGLFDSVKMDPYQRLLWMMVILGFLGWAGVARLVRGQILSLREQEFMSAAEATGLRAGRRIFRHLIPNVMPQLIVNATMGLGSVIIMESTLSFLGLGVKHPLATWGTMINSVTNSSESITRYAYIWVPVGLLICLTVIAFNFVGDGLRDAFDPKMKR